MGEVLELGLIWIFSIALIIFPLWLSFKIFNHYRRVKSPLTSLAIIPIGFAIFSIIVAFHPFSSHYKKIYREITGTKFPSSSKVIQAYSSLPAFMEKRVLIRTQLSEEELSHLSQFIVQNGYLLDKDPPEYQKLKFNVSEHFNVNDDETISRLYYKNILTQENYLFYNIAFMGDGKTVILQKVK